jgi:hypothetical protein
VSENRVLRRIFGSKRDEVTGEWRELSNVRLNDLYSTQYCLDDQIENNDMGEACSTYGAEKRCIQDFLRKRRERPLGRPRCI